MCILFQSRILSSPIRVSSDSQIESLVTRRLSKTFLDLSSRLETYLGPCHHRVQAAAGTASLMLLYVMRAQPETTTILTKPIAVIETSIIPLLASQRILTGRRHGRVQPARRDSFTRWHAYQITSREATDIRVSKVNSADRLRAMF